MISPLFVKEPKKTLPFFLEEGKMLFVHPTVARSPSGKARGFEPLMRRFESYPGSHLSEKKGVISSFTQKFSFQGKIFCNAKI